MLLLYCFIALWFPTPTAAQSCQIDATPLGGGQVSYDGTCPSGWEALFELEFDGTTIRGTPDDEGNFDGLITLPDGTYIGTLRCGNCDPTDPACMIVDWRTCQSGEFTISGSPLNPTPFPLPKQWALAGCNWVDASGQQHPGIKTGLGCLPRTPSGVTLWALRLAAQVAGGLALLFLLIGGAKWVTSAGDPKAVMEAKETITAALAGLILVVFSVLILKIIGYEILHLPGFAPTGGGGVTIPGT